MDDALWLRHTLVGTVIEATNRQACTIADIDARGILVQASGTDRRWLLPMGAIVATMRLWSRLERPPSPEELRQAGAECVDAPYLMPLVRVLRSVPQARAWTALPATQAVSLRPKLHAAD